MDLLARWIEESEMLDYDLLERRLSILSLLVESDPELWRCVSLAWQIFHDAYLDIYLQFGLYIHPKNSL